jgi:ElaB/YqjD/DUF883 family membrane-anchored ribosome-binding protein
MSDTNDGDTLKPMTDADIETPAADAALRAADPLKGAGSSPGTDSAGKDVSATISNLTQTLKDKTADTRAQAGDKARVYAEDGKAKATDALGQLSQMLVDAAGQVDERLGEQYGQYARSAADKVQGFSSQLDAKSVDELFDDARELVKKSPAVAIGVAAAFGFVVARLLTAGADQRNA